MRGFRAPTAAAVRNATTFIQALSRARIPSGLAPALQALSAIRLRTPLTATALNSYERFFQLVRTAPIGQLNALAGAMGRMSAAGTVRAPRIPLPRSTAALGGGGHGAAIGAGLGAGIGLHGIVGGGLAGFGLAGLTRSIADAARSAAVFRQQLVVASSDAAELAGHMDFVRQVTSELPVSIEATQNSYGRLAIAGKLSGASAEDIQTIYHGLATAFTVTHASADEVARGLLAVEQMFNANRVRAQELRIQLAQVLPGAFELMAKAMGVSTRELDRLLQEGKVGIENLTKLGHTLDEVFGPGKQVAIRNLTSQTQFFHNALFELRKTVSDSGFSAGFGAMFERLTAALRSPEAIRSAQALGSAFRALATGIGAFVDVASKNMGVISTAAKEVGLFVAASLGLRLAAGAWAFITAPMTLAALAVAFLTSEMLGWTNILDDIDKEIQDKVQKWNRWGFKDFTFGGEDSFSDVENFIKGAGRLFRAWREMSPTDDWGLTTPGGIQKLWENWSRIAEQDKLAEEAGKNSADAYGKGFFDRATDFFTNFWQNSGLAAAFEQQDKLADQYQESLSAIEKYGTASQAAAEDVEELARSQQRLLDTLQPVKAQLAEYQQGLNLIAGLSEQGYGADEIAKLRQNLDLLTHESLVEAIKRQDELIAKGQSGFAQWAAAAEEFSDSLKRIENETVDGFLDELTKALTGDQFDFISVARGALQSIVKAGLTDIGKSVFSADVFKRPFENIFGESKASQEATRLMAGVTAIGTQNVQAGTVNVFGAGTYAPGVIPPTTPVSYADQRIQGAFAAAAEAAPTNYADRRIQGAFDVIGGGVGISGATMVPSAGPFLDLIASAEVGRNGGYNTTLGHGKFIGGERNLTAMTLDQIDALQTQMLRNPANTYNASPVGRYQIVQQTMRGLRGQMGLTGSELFTPQLQDQMAVALAQARGNNVAGLRSEWAGLRGIDASAITQAYHAQFTQMNAATAAVNQMAGAAKGAALDVGSFGGLIGGLLSGDRNSILQGGLSLAGC